MVGLTWGCRKGNRENSTRHVREQGGGGGSSGQHDHATARHGIDHPCLAAFTQPSRTGPTATTNTGTQRESGRSPCQTAARRRRGSGTQGWHCVCAQAAAVSVLRALAGALCACHRAACRAHLPPCVLRCWYSARTAPRSPAPGSRLPGRVAATGTVRVTAAGYMEVLRAVWRTNRREHGCAHTRCAPWRISAARALGSRAAARTRAPSSLPRTSW